MWMHANRQEAMTEMYKQRECVCATLADGTQIRKYRMEETITRRPLLRKAYKEATSCSLYMKWENDKFVEWVDLEVVREVWNDSVITSKKAELPCVTQYYKCGREQETVRVSRTDYPYGEYLETRWKRVPLQEKKFRGEIRKFLCGYDGSKDYYLLYDPSDDVEDPHPQKIDAGRVDALFTDCRYERVPEWYLEEQLDHVCRWQDYDFLEKKYMPDEYKYLQRQLASMDKQSKAFTEVTERIEILAERLGDDVPDKKEAGPGFLKRFGIGEKLAQLQELNMVP